MELQIVNEIEVPNKVLSFIKLARLKFLIYSALSYSLGTIFCIAFNAQEISIVPFMLGLVAVWSTHLMTHFCNEYFDFEADKANKAFTKSTGGSRILVNGYLQPKTSLYAAFIFLLISLLLVFILPNLVSAGILLTAIFIGWFYTSPPFSLNYRRLGEFSVATTLSFLVPLIGLTVQTGEISFELLLLMTPFFLFQYTRMLIMNLADYEGDIQVNKFTMASTLGPNKTIILYGFGQFVAYLLLFIMYLIESISLLVLLSILCTLPIAIWQYLRIKNNGFSNSITANSITFWASTLSATSILTLYFGIGIECITHVENYTKNQILSLWYLTIPLVFVFGVMLVQVLKLKRKI